MSNFLFSFYFVFFFLFISSLFPHIYIYYSFQILFLLSIFSFLASSGNVIHALFSTYISCFTSTRTSHIAYIPHHPFYLSVISIFFCRCGAVCFLCGVCGHILQLSKFSEHIFFFILPLPQRQEEKTHSSPNNRILLSIESYFKTKYACNIHIIRQSKKKS